VSDDLLINAFDLYSSCPKFSQERLFIRKNDHAKKKINF
jgi:hypothetical protein